MNVTSKQKHAVELWAYAEQAAEEIGVRLYNLRHSGKGIAFTLKTGNKIERREDWRGKQHWAAKYQRTSQRERTSSAKGFEGVRFYPTIPGAVCWHGHRDFLRALYRRVPDAKIRTAFITYQNAEDFEARYRDTYDGAPGGNNTQRHVYYRPYEDACTCTEA